jgi:hypothetical protein
MVFVGVPSCEPAFVHRPTVLITSLAVRVEQYSSLGY